MAARLRLLLRALPPALVLLAAPGWSAPPRLPELAYPFADQADRWINSEPLSVRDLRGKPTLVMFWTYGCHNCRNSIAWINEMHRRFAPLGLQVIGIHTPEFDHEKDAGRVARSTREHGIEFPVMLDNDFVFWKDMRNMYWPSFYLADALGEIKAEHFGELHLETEASERIELLIQEFVANS